jgi:ribosomal protein S18 acetylase RimI-like enzyme
MSDDFVIRRWSPERDREALRDLFIALQDHEHAFAPEAPTGVAIVDAYLAWMFERCERYAGEILVAEAEGRVVAFMTVLVRVPRQDPDDPAEAHAMISELSVLPQWRGRAIGTALIEAAEALAREHGVAELRVMVDARNHGAQRLYARHGFDPWLLTLGKTLAPAEA